MKKAKILSIISLVLIMALSLTACTSGQIKLKKAMNKQKDIKAFDGDVKLSLNLEEEGLSEEDKIIFGMIKETLDNFELKMNLSVNSQSDLKGRSHIAMEAKYGEETMPFEVWSDVDLEGEKSSMSQILKFPEAFIKEMGEGAREYVLYDYDDLINYQSEAMGLDQPANLDLNKITEWGLKVGPRLQENLEVIGAQAFKGIEVKEEGLKGFNGKFLNSYRIKINDSQAKEALRTFLVEILKNEEMDEIFREYMELVFEITPLAEEEIVEVKEGLAKALDNKKVMEKNVNDFMDKLDGINLIGPKGIDLVYGLDSRDYISYEGMEANLELDLKDLPEPREGKIKLTIKTESNIDNINSKDIKVELPLLDEKNSMKYSDLLKLQAEKAQEALESLELEEKEGLDYMNIEK